MHFSQSPPGRRLLLSGAPLQIGRDKPEARLSVFGCAEWEKKPCVRFLADKSLMTELPCSILLSPLNRISSGKAISPRGQLEGCVGGGGDSTSQKVAFIEQSSSRISHNGCIERRGLCGLRVCITVRRRMTNMVLSQALLSNLSEIAPEQFDQRVAHRDVCGKCLQEKKTPTSGPRWSLYPGVRAARTTKGHKSSGTSLFVRLKILWLSVWKHGN